MTMKKLALLFSAALLSVWAMAAEFSRTYDGFCVGPVRIEATEAGAWSFSAQRIVGVDGVEEVEIALATPTPTEPPKFTVSFAFGQGDISHKWSTKHLEKVTLPPDWYCRTTSRLCSEIPLVTFLNGNDKNRGRPRVRHD